MHTYSETLARRIVARVARARADDPTAWVMLHDVARDLKVTEESAVFAMRVPGVGLRRKALFCIVSV
jgi:hypothetical protein